MYTHTHVRVKTDVCVVGDDYGKNVNSFQRRIHLLLFDTLFVCPRTKLGFFQRNSHDNETIRISHFITNELGNLAIYIFLILLKFYFSLYPLFFV